MVFYVDDVGVRGGEAGVHLELLAELVGRHVSIN